MAIKRIIIGLVLGLSFNMQAQTLEFKHTEQGFKFWESLPAQYDPQQKYPLIVFLHGRGERGDTTKNSEQNALTWGPLRHIKHYRFHSFTYNSKKYSFIVIAPQIDKPASFWEPALVDQVINYAVANYAVDVRRIYLTGLSMGGNGTWNYAYSDFNAQNRLAAIVPIAAWGNPTKACKVGVRKIPVWAFHGTEDNVVAFSKGKEVFDAAKQCVEDASTQMIFTAYEKTKHDSWQKAYDVRNQWHTPNVYQWLLSHELPEKSTVAITKSVEKRYIPPVKIRDPETASITTQPVGELKDGPLRLVTKLPASLKENSGLIFDNRNNLWANNDSGNGPFLFRLDTTGAVQGFKKVVHASNFDWEDLTIDPENNLYIGDIGNNENNRKKLIIYKVNLNDTSSRMEAKTISFSYEDQTEFPPPPSKQKFDAESLIFMNGFLYIFTKNRAEPFDATINVYQVPAQEGDHVARLVDTLILGEENMLDNWITGAAISNDNQYLVLLSHSKFWLISCFKNDHFSGGQIQEIPLNMYSKKEGITFYHDAQLYISDESTFNLGDGNLYKMDVRNLLKSCNN